MKFFSLCSIILREVELSEEGYVSNVGQLNPLPPSDAVRQQKINIFEDLFSAAGFTLGHYVMTWSFFFAKSLKCHYF